ncbi:MAG TPA: hypothetical protein IGS52_12535 [Oscillatoriaceae cyanobacterium M33_DOE_052]|nr:hypothetical protein [Oscillatoriaceae cyanobacterium M33_DOE_052]
MLAYVQHRLKLLRVSFGATATTEILILKVAGPGGNGSYGSLAFSTLV